MPIIDRPLPYATRLALRSAEAITGVVIHCTELPDLAMARDYGERVLYPDSGTGASGHYYVDRDGRTECWVDPLRVAHHCRGYNAHTLGIELVNLGRYPDWLHAAHQQPEEPYAEAQITALIALLRWLRQRYAELRWYAGHEDLDREWVPAADRPELRVRRKIDPGPLFPWKRVRAALPDWQHYRPDSAPSSASEAPATAKRVAT